MTEQERNIAFQTELENTLASLSKKYGFAIDPYILMNNLDGPTQVYISSYANLGNIKAAVRTVSIPGWQPPAEMPAANGNNSTDNNPTQPAEVKKGRFQIKPYERKRK